MIYVLHGISGKILFVAGGGKHSVSKAIDYVARRHAINNALAIRNGYAANVYEPLKIISHSGRPHQAGDNLFVRNTAKTKDKYIRTKIKWVEIVEVLPYVIALNFNRIIKKFNRLRVVGLIPTNPQNK